MGIGRLSPEARQIQLQWILVVFLLISGCYCLNYWAWEVRFVFCGATAQACVVGVGDSHDSRGFRTSQRIDYQYFDQEAKLTRSGSYYARPTTPTPALGQTITVQYLPNHADSSCLPENNTPGGLLCATIPLLLLSGLAALSVHRGEWIFF